MNGIPDTMKWRGHTWYLHSYVYGKSLALSTASRIRRTHKYGVARIIRIAPETGERFGRFAVYWRISK